MDTARRPGELAFACRDVRLLLVDAAGAGIAGRSAEWLPPDATADGASSPDVRYVVEPRPPAWNGQVSGHRVVRDGTVRYLGGSVESLLRWLRADIETTLAARSGSPLVVRAAAVVWRERGILIAGRPGSGTAHLAAALVRLGAARAAEPLVSIGDDGRVRPYPPMPAAPPVDVALVVSTTYHPRASWQPRQLRGARAVLPIVDCALPTADAARRVLHRAARLAPGLVTLQGPRPDAALAAPRILAALDDLLDAGPSPSPRLPEPIARARRALAQHLRAGAEAPGAW